MTLDKQTYEKLPTERPNPQLRHLDTLNSLELVDAVHGQDLEALRAVGKARQAIGRVVDAVSTAFEAGGRLIYLGAGTSGRLAMLDAAECPPTFGVPASQVSCLMAGGHSALVASVEGAEDSASEGRESVQQAQLAAPDIACGISASGTAAFVLAGLDEARRRGCRTALITSAPAEQVQIYADLLICLAIGSETIAGSTRMKSGLAQKAVLHTLSTAAMVLSGRVYDNLMVDVQPTNRKLRDRAARIVATLTGLDGDRAAALLERAGLSPKVAAVMHHCAVDVGEAKARLTQSGGRLRPLIGAVTFGES